MSLKLICIFGLLHGSMTRTLVFPNGPITGSTGDIGFLLVVFSNKNRPFPAFLFSIKNMPSGLEKF